MNETINKVRERQMKQYDMFWKDKGLTFEMFLLIVINSLEDDVDVLLEAIQKLDPSYFQEIDEECEELFDAIKEQDKATEEKFKEEYI
tara:strand:+ start:299 stop:562 length:264 start_codon:yes stop_codon:yes gene_type:complete